MSQIALPVEISPLEVTRKRSLGAAIALCAEAAGLESKQVMDALRVDGKPLDKAQWSRWESGQEGVVWPKLRALMDFCGNDAPLLWMNHDRGYDITSLRRSETENEKTIRLLTEENMALKRVLLGGKP